MQKGQNWLFTPTQPFSLSFFVHCTFTFQKKNMWHLLENSTWCALPPELCPTPLPLGGDVFPIKLQIHSAFPELFIRHLSPPRYLLHHNSAPKFRRYIKTLPSGPRWWLLPFFGSKANRLKEAVPAPCLVLYYHKDSVKVAQNTQCDMI